MTNLVSLITGMVLVSNVVTYTDTSVRSADGTEARGNPFEDAALYSNGIKVYPLPEIDQHRDLWIWENRTILFLRRIGILSATATEAPADVEHQVEERLYALSQDDSQAALYVALVTRASVLRDQITRKGGSMASIRWHPEVSP